MSEHKGFTHDHAVCFALGLLIGMLCCCWGMVGAYRSTKESFQKEAIEHNVAEYNSKTGEWQWKQLKEVKK